jgi:hypothetical protein
MERIGEHSSSNSPWENAFDLVTPAAEVDRLKDVAHTQALMISEITSACMTAEQERDKAVATVKHTAAAMLKAATAMQEAARLAAAAGAVDVVETLSDALMDVDLPSAVQVEPGGDT